MTRDNKQRRLTTGNRGCIASVPRRITCGARPVHVCRAAVQRPSTMKSRVLAVAARRYRAPTTGIKGAQPGCRNHTRSRNSPVNSKTPSPVNSKTPSDGTEEVYDQEAEGEGSR